MLSRAGMLGIALPALLWLQPPPVLPTPSRTGAEGPPRPAGEEPRPGASAPRTEPGPVQAQNRALLEGPFPHDGLTRGVSEGTLALDQDSRVRALAFARIRETGSTVVRIPVDWRDTVVPAPPASFDARDPASPEYRFARLDASVRDAIGAGLTPLLVVSHAPVFAEAPARWPYAYPGSWSPDPAALEAFAAALASRYGGSFPDPLEAGVTLPRVRLLQAWNEPNLARYLEPQWIAEDGRWSAFSPREYRALLNAFYAGVKSVEPSDVVATAGVAPGGDRDGVGRMAPMRFLRVLLCLPAGRSRALRCADPPHFDVLAFHPLSVGDPDLPAVSSLDLAIADAAKITGLLRRASSLHAALPATPKGLWVTELNWESAPQSPHGVPARLQAQWISRALHRLWVAGVSLATWQFLVDPYPAARANTPTGGLVEYPRPAGLYAAGPGGDPERALPKPFLRGFSFPFDPLRVDRRRVRVWALLARPRQPVLLQREARGGTWPTIAHLHADHNGVLNVLVSLRGRARVRLLSGTLSSAVEPVPAAPSRL
jgi:hypothetical protein